MFFLDSQKQGKFTGKADTAKLLHLAFQVAKDPSMQPGEFVFPKMIVFAVSTMKLFILVTALTYIFTVFIGLLYFFYFFFIF